MSRVGQPNMRRVFDDPVRTPVRPKATRNRATVRARLARVKEHLEQNALFALTADQIDGLAVQQAQWEATAYAAAAEILDRARTEADGSGNPGPYSGRHQAESSVNPLDLPATDGPIPIDAVRPKLWPVVTALIEQYRGDEDLELYFGLLHRTFSWVERNSESMPRAAPAIREWLQEGCCQVLWESAGWRRG